jgi:hypothetical protein
MDTQTLGPEEPSQDLQQAQHADTNVRFYPSHFAPSTHPTVHRIFIFCCCATVQARVPVATLAVIGFDNSKHNNASGVDWERQYGHIVGTVFELYVGTNVMCRKAPASGAWNPATSRFPIPANAHFIAVSVPAVSSQHAAIIITLHSSGLHMTLVRDLASSNGTWKTSKGHSSKLDAYEDTSIDHGDTIVFGNVKCVYKYKQEHPKPQFALPYPVSPRSKQRPARPHPTSTTAATTAGETQQAHQPYDDVGKAPRPMQLTDVGETQLYSDMSAAEADQSIGATQLYDTAGTNQQHQYDANSEEGLTELYYAYPEHHHGAPRTTAPPPPPPPTPLTPHGDASVDATLLYDDDSLHSSNAVVGESLSDLEATQAYTNNGPVGTTHLHHHQFHPGGGGGESTQVYEGDSSDGGGRHGLMGQGNNNTEHAEAAATQLYVGGDAGHPLAEATQLYGDEPGPPTATSITPNTSATANQVHAPSHIVDHPPRTHQVSADNVELATQLYSDEVGGDDTPLSPQRPQTPPRSSQSIRASPAQSSSNIRDGTRTSLMNASRATQVYGGDSDSDEVDGGDGVNGSEKGEERTPVLATASAHQSNVLASQSSSKPTTLPSDLATPATTQASTSTNTVYRTQPSSTEAASDMLDDDADADGGGADADNDNHDNNVQDEYDSILDFDIGFNRSRPATANPAPKPTLSTSMAVTATDPERDDAKSRQTKDGHEYKPQVADRDLDVSVPPPRRSSARVRRPSQHLRDKRVDNEDEEEDNDGEQGSDVDDSLSNTSTAVNPPASSAEDDGPYESTEDTITKAGDSGSGGRSQRKLSRSKGGEPGNDEFRSVIFSRHRSKEPATDSTFPFPSQGACHDRDSSIGGASVTVTSDVPAPPLPPIPKTGDTDHDDVMDIDVDAHPRQRQEQHQPSPQRVLSASAVAGNGIKKRKRSVISPNDTADDNEDDGNDGAATTTTTDKDTARSRRRSNGTIGSQQQPEHGQGSGPTTPSKTKKAKTNERPHIMFTKVAADKLKKLQDGMAQLGAVIVLNEADYKSTTHLIADSIQRTESMARLLIAVL